MNTEHEKFVRDWHASSCAAARANELRAANTPCAHCGNPRTAHHYEELKCDLYVTSYVPKNRAEVSMILQTIEALEKLAAIRGWIL